MPADFAKDGPDRVGRLPVIQPAAVRKQAKGARRLLFVSLRGLRVIRAALVVVAQYVMESRMQAGASGKRAHQQHHPDQQRRNQPTQKRGPARLAERSVLQSDCKMSTVRGECKSRVKFCGPKFGSPTAS